MTMCSIDRPIDLARLYLLCFVALIVETIGTARDEREQPARRAPDRIFLDFPEEN